MDYKIAVASSDGTKVDLTFGAADSFLIYDVKDGVYSLSEKRTAELPEKTAGTKEKQGCSGNHSGCGGNGGGCGDTDIHSARVELLSDCRSVVCLKIGFHVQKLLQKKAISAFDVDCSVEEALSKITAYYKRTDK